MKQTAFPPQALGLRPRWLVVDDQSDLSELVATVLAGLDLASVENFTSPAAALAAFSQRSGGFDLIVTDRDMPGFDGLELSRRIHELAPAAKVVLVSAHTADLPPEALAGAGISAVIQKPFELSQLEAVARAMSAPASPRPEFARAA